MKKYKDLLFTGDAFLLLFTLFVVTTTIYDILTIKNPITYTLTIVILILFLISGTGIIYNDLKKK